MTAMARIGISGWRYPSWRGIFYPTGLPQRQELEYAAHRMNSVELNGSFYSLQRPSSYLRWAEQTPDDFLFSVKGSRFITHMRRLSEVDIPLANFFASGLLALGHKLGPILWQLPARQTFDPARMEAFFRLLPRTTGQAADLARRHDQRLDGRSFTDAPVETPLRHVLEVRHDSFCAREALDLLRHHGIGLVIADSAGVWPMLFDVTADLVYVRLHGAQELYASGYTPTELDTWARRIECWLDEQLDVFVYFDNDIKAHAPFDAIELAGRIDRTHVTPLPSSPSATRTRQQSAGV